MNKTQKLASIDRTKGTFQEFVFDINLFVGKEIGKKKEKDAKNTHKLISSSPTNNSSEEEIFEIRELKKQTSQSEESNNNEDKSGQEEEKHIEAEEPIIEETNPNPKIFYEEVGPLKPYEVNSVFIQKDDEEVEYMPVVKSKRHRDIGTIINLILVFLFNSE
jgi:hypothetical protein